MAIGLIDLELLRRPVQPLAENAMAVYHRSDQLSEFVGNEYAG